MSAINLRNDERGAVAVMFAVLLTVVVAVIGGAIDFGRMHSQKAKLQNSLDAAVLSAAAEYSANPTLSVAHLKERISGVYEKGAQSARWKRADDNTVDVVIENNVITATVSDSVETTFLNILAIETLPVNVLSSSSVASGGALEVALVLDNSESMDLQKHTAMIDGARAMIAALTNGGTNTATKVGLVPFSSYVVTDLPGENYFSGVAGQNEVRCTQDRKYPYNLADTRPDPSNPDTLWSNQAHALTAESLADCNDRIAGGHTVRPLTNDHAGIEPYLSALRVFPGTNIFAGLQFGWHVLSPEGTWGTAAHYGAARKILVVLTDGRQNRSSYGPNGEFSDEMAEQNTLTLCDTIKAKGITIIAVAYEIDDPTGKDAMRTCASEEQFFVEGTESTIVNEMTGVANRAMQKVVSLRR